VLVVQESTKSGEILPERSGGAPRPEPEIARPEVGDALHAGRDPGVVSDSPTIDSSGETVETPSGLKTPFFGPSKTGNRVHFPSVRSHPFFHWFSSSTNFIFHCKYHSARTHDKTKVNVLTSASEIVLKFIEH